MISSVSSGVTRPSDVAAIADAAPRDSAANDPTAIAYIGELTPGSSVPSIRVLNRAGILQVSPGDSAPEATETPSLHGRSDIANCVRVAGVDLGGLKPEWLPWVGVSRVLTAGIEAFPAVGLGRCGLAVRCRR